MVYWIIIPFTTVGIQWHNLWTMSSLLRLSLALSLLSSLQPLGWALHFSPTLIPEASRLGVSAGPVPRDEGGAGSWTRCTWPSGSGYILDPLTLATSQWTDCPLAQGVENCLWCQDRLSRDSCQRSWWYEGDMNWKLPLVSRQTLQRLLLEKLMTWGGYELAEGWDGLGSLVL